MNPSEMQKMIDESNRMMDGLLVGPAYAPGRMMMWSMQHPEAAWVITIIYLLVWLHAIWHCLSSHTGPDRTTWLVLLLFLPFFGIVFYWSLANRTERQTGHAIYRPAPPAPPAPTTRSIAEEITANLAKRKRP